jgi:hypothetical protein
MTTQAAFFMQTYYSGTVTAKLTAANELLGSQATRFASPAIQKGLEGLRQQAFVLEQHMQAMELGRLCSLCASQPGGGCCSAYMADNTDSILMLINLLLGIKVQIRNSHEESCCFLGEQGCLFLVKPIFCLNYNCKAILDSAGSDALGSLYRLAGAVLSKQTRLETLLLDALKAEGER